MALCGRRGTPKTALSGRGQKTVAQLGGAMAVDPPGERRLRSVKPVGVLPGDVTVVSLALPGGSETLKTVPCGRERERHVKEQHGNSRLLPTFLYIPRGEHKVSSQPHILAMFFD